MSLTRLLLRNLFWHWRGNLAVMLGVALGTAVLTGALLVGDSLRGSLRELTLDRLGWVDYALVGGRFIRQDVAEEMTRDAVADRIAPALLLRGSASTPRRPTVGQITVLGVTPEFWADGRVPVDAAFWQQDDDPDRRPVVLNAALVRELEVSPGDRIVFHLQKVSAMPRESLLGYQKTQDVDRLELTVSAVLSDDQPGARFSLNPMPTAPRNAFVPLRVLQAVLQSQEGRTRALPDRPVNALLVRGGQKDRLQVDLRKHLTLDDWALVLRDLRHVRPPASYLSLESRHMFLDPVVVRAVRESGLTTYPTLVYLVNNIGNAHVQAARAAASIDPGSASLLTPLAAYYGPIQVPYSIIAAVDPAEFPPLRPFQSALAGRQRAIVLVKWDGSPLKDVKENEPITLSYFLPEEGGRLPERTEAFRLVGQTPLEGAARDRYLTPQFPGITDRLDLSSWDDPPFPFDKSRIRPRDEAYWNRYRTTPKAYVSLAEGQALWGSRFGQLTSFRIVPGAGAESAEAIEERLLSHLDPEQGGFVFDDVRERSLQAGAGGTDFGVLFLSFSIFLIGSALLLVGLLFRLNLDRRAAETGLFLAMGYRRLAVALLLLAEGGLLAAVGGLLGLGGATLYAGLLLDLLKAWWPGGGLDQSFLRVHPEATSFVIGYVTTLTMSLVAIAWAMLLLRRVPAVALLAGETVPAPGAGQKRGRRWSTWIAGVTGVAALACVAVGRRAGDAETQALTFFSSGFLLLVAALAGTWSWMHGTRHVPVSGQGTWALTRLAIRNAARHPVRSLLTAGLLASAVFLVIAVESFHEETGKDFLARDSGSGGFALVGESAVPVYQDLKSATGKDIVPGTEIESCRLHAGDDASCLNLYQPRQPRLLGVPTAFVRRGGFRFTASEAQTAEETSNPWRLLEQATPPGEPLPVIADANTAEWMLHLGLGKTIEVPNEQGEPTKLRLVGLLQKSIFQSELLLSEANFLKLYPHQEGYNFFLVATPPGQTAEVRRELEQELAPRGLELTSTRDRLQSYLAVENTYLMTFQALGSLGLILGAIGLAIVLLRSVWERRGELALLRALGYRQSALGWLLLAENGFLLVLGLGIGAVTALVAVAPHWVGGLGQVPWLRIVVLLMTVLAVGLVAGAGAVAGTLRAPLLAALRRE
jgi:ABC-type lipoprotein release transport system permease subunit